MSNDPHIEGTRLTLRPVSPNDLDDLHCLWIDSDVHKYLWDDEIISRELVASIRVMEKAGMRFEKRVIVNGRDTVYYKISREEFQTDEPVLERKYFEGNFRWENRD